MYKTTCYYQKLSLNLGGKELHFKINASRRVQRFAEKRIGNQFDSSYGQRTSQKAVVDPFPLFFVLRAVVFEPPTSSIINIPLTTVNNSEYNTLSMAAPKVRLQVCFETITLSLFQPELAFQMSGKYRMAPTVMSAYLD
jgi:hypothetical protein